MNRHMYTCVYTHTHGLSEYLVLSNQFGGSLLGKTDFIAQHTLISCGVPSRGGPCEISPSSVACQLMLPLLRAPLGGHIFAVSCLIWKTSSPTKLPVLLAHGLVTCSLPPPPMTGHFLVSHSTKALSSPAHRSSVMTTDTPGRNTELCRPSTLFCSHWPLMWQRLPPPGDPRKSALATSSLQSTNVPGMALRNSDSHLRQNRCNSRG